MKAVQVSKPGGNFEIVERPIPEPGRGQVRIKAEACGICHSDVLVKDGLWLGIQDPRVPGHEIAGRVDAIGADVTLQAKKETRDSIVPLTRDFKQTIQARARRDPAFRSELLREAIESFLSGDVETGKAVLRDYIHATVGFDELAGGTRTRRRA